jgi:hypothetical protein
MYILWVRHGFSCANYFHFDLDNKKFQTELKQDAKLTNIGYDHTHKASSEIFKKFSKIKKRGKKLDLIPIFFSSMLSRAMKTSDAFREGSRINYPTVLLPYVEEVPDDNKESNIFDISNTPKNVNDLNLDFDVHILSGYPKLNPYDDKGEPVKFYKRGLFYNRTLPEIVKVLKDHGYKITDNTTIAVFSHHDIIERNTGISLGNTGSVLQHLTKSSNSFKKGSSEVVFPGFYYEDYDLKKKDLKICF